MRELLEPIKTESLVDAFIARFEELILSGKLSIGQKLPSERELALQLGVSRPVVHEGLVDLASKGLVTMIPRIGTLINDYRKDGSLTLLTSLVNYHDGRLEPKILEGLLRMRVLFEVETARLAALNRTDEHLNKFYDLIDEEREIDVHNTTRITKIDFDFHHLIAMATDNMIYPLLINTFKQVYINLTRQFFSDTTLVSDVFRFHKAMVDAIAKKDDTMAVAIMKQMLDHGEEHLKITILNENNPERRQL
jgi:GntR family transcriptional repressor for pyruvate dehydrogenase complex